MKVFILSFLVVIWLILSPAGVLALNQATLSLEPLNGTFNTSCTFDVKINLNTDGAQTDGTDAILIYDPTRFLGQSITNGNIYPDYPGNNIDNATGKITISGLASVATPFTGQGTLATINFKVADNAPPGATQVNFDFDPNNKAKTTDSNVVQRGTVVDLLNSVANGNFVIGTGSCNAQSTPTPSPSAGATSAPGVTPAPTPGGYTGGGRGTPGGYYDATPPAQSYYPTQPPQQKNLPPAGSEQLTFTMGIVGGVLTVLGILGLALL